MQCDTALFLIEIDIFLLGNLLSGGGLFIQEAFYDDTAFDVARDDLFHILDMDQTIQGIFRIDLDKWALGAEAEAANLIDSYLLIQAFLLQDLLKFVHDLGGVVGKTSGTAAEHDVTLSVLAGQLVIQALGTYFNLFI